MSHFLEHPDLHKMTEEALHIKESGKQFSDTIDPDGLQYVDLVQEGGGVLGIGLVGYTYILEKAGIRFYSLAGTSAGSINTLLIAGLGQVGDPVSEKILDILSRQNLFDFVDGPKGVKKLIQKKIEGKDGLLWGLIFNARVIFTTLKEYLGLNPGDEFLKWLARTLSEAGINTFADLNKKRNQLTELKNRQDHGRKMNPPSLALVASDITTHTKADFPRMAPLYWKDVDNIHPASFARASMSIPYFFYPFTVKGIPNAGAVANPLWDEFASYRGPVPPEVRFVDGGMLSNFPINIFHNNSSIPTRPTFGVRLSTYRKDFSKTDSFFSMSGAMVSTMRQIHDYDFILRNPDFRQLICNIDADQKFNWLNFNMPPERQAALFRLGAEKGLEFLKCFDWEKYKETRKKLLEANALIAPLQK